MKVTFHQQIVFHQKTDFRQRKIVHMLSVMDIRVLLHQNHQINLRVKQMKVKQLLQMKAHA